MQRFNEFQVMRLSEVAVPLQVATLCDGLHSSRASLRSLRSRAVQKPMDTAKLLPFAGFFNAVMHGTIYTKPNASEILLDLFEVSIHGKESRLFM